MKVKIFVFFSIFILISCNKNIIGHTDGNNKIIDVDLLKISNEWNILIKENNINCKLLKFEIRKDYDLENNTHYYYFYGFSSDKNVKMARILILKNNQFYFDIDEKLFVVCHESKLCEPKRYNYQWICNTENLVDENCKKTTIVKY